MAYGTWETTYNEKKNVKYIFLNVFSLQYSVPLVYIPLLYSTVYYSTKYMCYIVYFMYTSVPHTYCTLEIVYITICNKYTYIQSYNTKLQYLYYCTCTCTATTEQYSTILCSIVQCINQYTLQYILTLTVYITYNTEHVFHYNIQYNNIYYWIVQHYIQYWTCISLQP